MTIEELNQQDSREEYENADFSDFRLTEENASDALADIRHGRGIHHDAGNDFSRFDDDDEIDLSDYVPAWA